MTTWLPPAGRYTISRTFQFAAAHHLPGLPDGHKCSRNHGHTWTVTVTVSSTTLMGPGWVVDWADLAPLGEFIATELDHSDLTAVMPVAPTAEHVAAFLADWCRHHLEPALGVQLESITIDEGGTSRVTFAPEGQGR